jgi:hypothetical protein
MKFQVGDFVRIIDTMWRGHEGIVTASDDPRFPGFYVVRVSTGAHHRPYILFDDDCLELIEQDKNP